ncbi:SIR2 family NAD-dependent protein deacylase [Pseudodesulfovibrio senegalensis]|jgi:NAD-dependent deacetylase|uniref:protein acetyllysine N-acetyltransferase n=1 Tax=Pseudodesulfovibrio senegalensis TaxID=1721087 RepID=A0A6N6N3H0_9BACT|nr:Sir2 family NAD-dependent protein deacetylase [Pseudodesulfovibrio senegalensis]KAB1441623.1 NAD-dependent protein deacylase [Pseudodesulfovibrio senegalensis]
MSNHALSHAAETIRSARHVIAFTGAGISVESGIAPFRGPGGLWSRFDPNLFDRNRFRREPEKSWELLYRLFYEGAAGRARPNAAHLALAEMEARGRLHAIITQNIDGLHHRAGSVNVLEYHGSTRTMTCMDCGLQVDAADVPMEKLPPRCAACGGVLKPDVVFFSEPIPDHVHRAALAEAKACDVCIVVGTSGEVMPAARIPRMAARHGAVVVEINVRESAYTYETSTIFLEGKAGKILPDLASEVIGK